MHDTISKYFPELTGSQLSELMRLPELYTHWNGMINVVSRKDTEFLTERHILHSLALALIWHPEAGAKVLDVGTGGGFPGIPLAIMYPEAHFTLVDSIGKKIKVAGAIVEELGLKNVTVINTRAESVEGSYDYVVSRAVAETATLAGWVWKKIRKGNRGDLANGMLLLKGGDLREELGRSGKKHIVFVISDFFDGEFFETKKIVYLPKT